VNDFDSKPELDDENMMVELDGRPPEGGALKAELEDHGLHRGISEKQAVGALIGSAELDAGPQAQVYPCRL
jgi:hypothetical protein